MQSVMVNLFSHKLAKVVQPVVETLKVALRCVRSSRGFGGLIV